MKTRQLQLKITAFLLAFALALPDSCWALRALSVQESSDAAGLSMALSPVAAGLEENKTDFFVGTRERKLDLRGRVSLPKRWEALWEAGSVFLRMEQSGDDAYLGLYPVSVKGARLLQHQQDDTEVVVDSQSRIWIDKGLLEWVGAVAGGTVVLLGVGDHLEIWNKGRWEKAREGLKGKYPSDLFGGLEEDYVPLLTDPQHHDPNRFTYVIHAVPGVIFEGIVGSLASIRANLDRSPLFISGSILHVDVANNEYVLGSYAPVAFILGVPREESLLWVAPGEITAPISTSPQPERIGYLHQLRLARAIQPRIGPAEFFQIAGRRGSYSEAIAEGRNLLGDQMRVTGILVNRNHGRFSEEVEWQVDRIREWAAREGLAFVDVGEYERSTEDEIFDAEEEDLERDEQAVEDPDELMRWLGQLGFTPGPDASFDLDELIRLSRERGIALPSAVQASARTSDAEDAYWDRFLPQTVSWRPLGASLDDQWAFIQGVLGRAANPAALPFVPLLEEIPSGQFDAAFNELTAQNTGDGGFYAVRRGNLVTLMDPRHIWEVTVSDKIAAAIPESSPDMVSWAVLRAIFTQEASRIRRIRWSAQTVPASGAEELERIPLSAIPDFEDRLKKANRLEVYRDRLVKKGDRHFLVKSEQLADPEQHRSVWPTVDNPIREYVAFRVLRELGCDVCDVEIPSPKEMNLLDQWLGGRPGRHYLVELSTDYSLSDPKVQQKDHRREETTRIMAALLLRDWDPHSGNEGPLSDSQDVQMMFDAEQAFHDSMSDLGVFSWRFALNYFEPTTFLRSSHASTQQEDPQEVRINSLALAEQIDMEALKSFVRTVDGLDLDALEREIRLELVQRYWKEGGTEVGLKLEPIFRNLKRWKADYLSDARRFFRGFFQEGFSSSVGERVTVVVNPDLSEQLTKTWEEVFQALTEVAQELSRKEPSSPVPPKTVARVAAVAQAIVDEMLTEEAGIQESRAVVLDGVSPLLKDPKFEALVTELQKSKTFQGRIVIWGDPPDPFLRMGLPIALDEAQLTNMLISSLQVKKATFIGNPNNIPSITGVVFNAPPPSFVALLTGLGVPGDIANSLVTELNSGLEEAQQLGVQA